MTMSRFGAWGLRQHGMDQNEGDCDQKSKQDE